MSNETMNVRVQTLAVAADRAALWHLPGLQAPYSGNLMADDDMVARAKQLVHPAKVKVIHGTSWCQDGPAVWHNLVAVVSIVDLVRDEWPEALPVTAAAAKHVGKPLPYVVDGPPLPRDFDVLYHALRHLAFLRDTDAAVFAALDDDWLRHLEPLEPVLAQMYQAA